MTGINTGGVVEGWTPLHVDMQPYCIMCQVCALYLNGCACSDRDFPMGPSRIGKTRTPPWDIKYSRVLLWNVGLGVRPEHGTE